MSSSKRRPSDVRRRAFRRSLLEALEPRQMFAVDWRNPVDALDINNDRRITAFDALEVINELSLNSNHSLVAPKPAAAPFLDATGNDEVSAFDALAVINYLNIATAPSYTLEEAVGKTASEFAVTITAGSIPAGSRTYQLKIQPQFDGTDTTASSEDILSVYLYDPATGQTVVDSGSDSTSLFSLAGTDAKIQNGLVQWDGSLLSIDLSSFSSTNTLQLRVQLLNVDADYGSKVLITPWTNTIDPLGVPRSEGPLRGIPALPGNAAVLSSYYSIPNLDLEIENVSFDSATGRFTAEARLANNTPIVVHNGAFLLQGLSAGTVAFNPSGTTGGVPYFTFDSVISPAGLAPGAKTNWIRIYIDVPPGESFALKPEVLGFTETQTLAQVGTFTGTISETEEQHNFIFPMLQHQDLLIVPMKFPSTFNDPSPTIRLFNPNNTVVSGFPDSLQDRFDVFDTPFTGHYRFELTGKAPGEFAVAFFDTTTAETLNLLDTRSGFIDPRIGPLFYSFEGSAGQTLLLENLLPTSETRIGTWRMVDRYGQEAGQRFVANNGDTEFQLTKTSRYYLVFSPPDYSTPTPYNFVLRAPVVTTDTLNFGGTTNVNITSFGQENAYTFAGTKNQQVIFDSLLPASDLTRFWLVNPAGERVEITEANSQLLDSTGTWKLVVRGDQLGSFAFRMYNVADLPALENGTIISGSVTNLESDFYRLPAVRGERFVLMGGGSEKVSYSLTGPAGQDIQLETFGGRYGLWEAGNTVVEIQAAASATGEEVYNYTAERTFQAPIAHTGFNVDYIGQAPSGNSTVATFNASAGTPIMIDMLAGEGATSAVTLSLMGAADVTSVTGDSKVIVLTKSGTYTIQATNTTGGLRPYAFRLLDLAVAPLLGDNEILNTSVASGKTLVRRIEGEIGDTMLFDTSFSLTNYNASMRIVTDDSDASAGTPESMSALSRFACGGTLLGISTDETRPASMKLSAPSGSVAESVICTEYATPGCLRGFLAPTRMGRTAARP